MNYGDKMINSDKIVIIRAENGWILEREKSNDFDEGNITVQEVFEDGNGGLDNRVGRAESLSNLLWEAFSPEYQSDFDGGLSIEVKECGSDYNEELVAQNAENGPDPLNIEKML
jgi:hypothetical protein